jgi:hypothetical protein
MTSSSEVALKFVDRINAHDLAGLVGLMTANHKFVDSLGVVAERPAMEDGWRQYFEMVPDYRIKIDRSFADGETAILVGSAGGTYVPEGGAMKPKNRWETPAVWVARIEGAKVAEWRIYADNEPIREKMR